MALIYQERGFTMRLAELSATSASSRASATNDRRLDGEKCVISSFALSLEQPKRPLIPAVLTYDAFPSFPPWRSHFRPKLGVADLSGNNRAASLYLCNTRNLAAHPFVLVSMIEQ
jgi:hypothetical protein